MLRIWIALMGFLSVFGKSRSMTTTNSSTAHSTTSSTATTLAPSIGEVEDCLRGALWGFLAGDALAAPTHWYYGGARQIVQDYGKPITDYTKPNEKLAGSILNKSNLNGGGRSSMSSMWGASHPQTIIGDVINHGKQDLWSPNKSIHYHATLQKGENTLEVSIARVLMKSIVANQGRFDEDHFRQAYVDFMQTPNSHNDTYASTCHRMFFANLVHKKLPPKECPDNDQHNVDVIDGLILPTIVALIDPSQAAACASVTRKSRVLTQVSPLWGSTVQAALLQSDDSAFAATWDTFSQGILGRPANPRVSDGSTMSACYLSQSLPGVVDLVAKYLPQKSKSNGNGSTKSQVWEALLANANVGGENVHRGSLMGAIWGARAGVSQLPDHLRTGLYPYDTLTQEIDEFCAAVLPKLQEHCRSEPQAQ